VTLDQNPQYNPNDFDPDWDAKEKAKMKVYANASSQTE
jgi:hypothetical protein